VCVSSHSYTACEVHVLLSSVACPPLPYFSTLSLNIIIFGKNSEHKMWVDFPYNFCLKHFSSQEELKSDIITDPGI